MAVRSGAGVSNSPCAPGWIWTVMLLMSKIQHRCRAVVQMVVGTAESAAAAVGVMGAVSGTVGLAAIGQAALDRQGCVSQPSITLLLSMAMPTRVCGPWILQQTTSLSHDSQLPVAQGQRKQFLRLDPACMLYI